MSRRRRCWAYSAPITKPATSSCNCSATASHKERRVFAFFQENRSRSLSYHGKNVSRETYFSSGEENTNRGVPHSSLYDPETQVALERIEVAVAMKKVMVLDDAKRRDDRVDRAARRHPASPQRAVIASGGNRDFMAAHGTKFESGENPLDTPKVGFGGEALQHFGHDQIADDKLRGREAAERIGFGCRPAIEVVDPHRRIDHDHRRGLRSRRIALRSPSQRNLP